jgi:integrase
MAQRRGFGRIQALPSGRYRARYTGPDGVLHNAPSTYETRLDAEGWLTDERRLIASDAWTPPTARAAAKRRASEHVLTFERYADSWLGDRVLRPRTRAHYRGLLDRHLIPAFGSLALAEITPQGVRGWHTTMGSARPTLRAHAYGLLRTVLASAVADELIRVNPCHIRGAGNSKRIHKIRPASLEQLGALVAAMPDRFQAMTLLAAWCGLRFGEVTELRRKDVDLKAGVVRIRRAVTRVDGAAVVGTPKSDAGTRDVSIPPHLVPVLRAHLAAHVAAGREALLFPSAEGGNLAPSSLYGRKSTQTRKGWGFYEAREVAGRPDLRWHDLRHTGAVLAASTGATLAELMGRLGHSTPAAALRYQHAAEGADSAITRRLSELAAASTPSTD